MAFFQSELWLSKAIGFVTRARTEMLGKHNAEIMAFLFEYGLSNKTSEKYLLGWNRRDKLRLAESWGAEEGMGRLFFPEGIVVPYIVEKILRKITIVIPGNDSAGNENHVVDGSLPESMIIGDTLPVGGRTCVIENILDGLYLLQEWRLNYENEKICLIIPHDLANPPDNAAGEQLEKAGQIIFLTPKSRESCRLWAREFENSDIHIYKNREELKKMTL